MALVLIAAVGLGYAVYRYGAAVPSVESLETKRNKAKPGGGLPGYNPHVLNQYQTMADAIYSADIKENDIHAKPSTTTDGVYGITEDHIKLNPGDPITIVTSKRNLNI
jgi:hypothetical protein